MQGIGHNLADSTDVARMQLPVFLYTFLYSADEYENYAQ